jgi:hypothetical protein
MKIVAWIVVILLLVAGIALLFDALTTTHSAWISIPFLLLSGLLGGLALIGLLALLGLYDLAVEVDGHRMEFRKRAGD